MRLFRSASSFGLYEEAHQSPVCIAVRVASRRDSRPGLLGNINTAMRKEGPFNGSRSWQSAREIGWVQSEEILHQVQDDVFLEWLKRPS